MGWSRLVLLGCVLVGCADDVDSEDPRPADCSRASHDGSIQLPDAFVGEPYAVDLLEVGGGIGGGVGHMIDGDIPDGLQANDYRLSGTPLETGTFELVLSWGDHWKPPGCPWPPPSTAAFTLLVVERAEGTGTGEAGGTQTDSERG